MKLYMKKNLLYTLLAGAALASMASCDVNAQNDKLDGFEGESSIKKQASIEYTFTDADYANLAANSDNIAKAGDALAKAVKSSEFTVPYTNVTELYVFDGSKWKAVNNIAVLQSDDYDDMGQKYHNLTEPNFYLPIYLKTNFPYAKAEDYKLVGYKLSKSGATSFACDKYVFDGAAWTKDNGVTVETAQFVKTGGKWMYDPNVTITLPAGKGQELSTLYFRACTDWVWENIDKAKLGVSEKGKGYVTSYGNNEYYCGTSAYQGNVDLRPAKAKEQYPAGYEGMTDDQILDLMKTRFATEVLPGALSTIHPDAVPIDGSDVIYTINFGVYTGSTSNYTIRYKVVGQGKFDFIDCTWNTQAE